MTVKLPGRFPFAVGAKTSLYAQFLPGASATPQVPLEIWKSPTIRTPINWMLTLPELVALTFFALLRLPNFAAKFAERG
jgi:hypothetical protein